MEEEDTTANALAKYEELASSLPYFGGVGGAVPYRKYENFWYLAHLLAPTLAIRDTFAARPTDIILTTMLKSGTTWLKALVFSIAHRDRHAPDDARHPLLGSSPHDLAPFLHSLYENYRSVPPGPLLDKMPSPRVLAVHTPLSVLPVSVAESKCRIVYLCRDPKDVVVSFWHYINKIKPSDCSVGTFAQAFEECCDGVWPLGPLWDHMAEYWKESVARPEEVMFLRYEHLKEDAVGSVRRLAEFLGYRFTDEEVGQRGSRGHRGAVQHGPDEERQGQPGRTARGCLVDVQELGLLQEGGGRGLEGAHDGRDGAEARRHRRGEAARLRAHADPQLRYLVRGLLLRMQVA